MGPSQTWKESFFRLKLRAAYLTRRKATQKAKALNAQAEKSNQS